MINIKEIKRVLIGFQFDHFAGNDNFYATKKNEKIIVYVETIIVKDDKIKVFLGEIYKFLDQIGFFCSNSGHLVMNNLIAISKLLNAQISSSCCTQTENSDVLINPSCSTRTDGGGEG